MVKAVIRRSTQECFVQRGYGRCEYLKAPLEIHLGAVGLRKIQVGSVVWHTLQCGFRL